MPDELLPTLAKAVTDPALWREVYGDLLKPGVTQVGKALSTVVGLGNTILWPVQLLNERGRLSLEANLERYREKLSKIPEEKISPVVPEIGVPIAEKLSYVSDPDLREMYTTLLAKASIHESQASVHPSFVNVLNNLTPDEAQLLKQFQKQGGTTPFVAARLRQPEKEGFYQIVDTHFRLEEDTTLAFPANLPAYVSNLEGLGLIRARTDVRALPDTLYDPLLEDMQEHFKQITQPPANMTLDCAKGKVEVTRFGWLFLAACAGQ